ncbi:hypothetical protein DFH09DRAFT_388963 [Mycena vulgaris]|nr:hypothetical protein DFH09DRAFT_388963 [Mycena vulgaris]
MPSAQEPGLKFIIVGASIAGLASAIALKASGHNVLVVEKESQLGGPDSRPSGGARVPPNGCKILFDWGLETEVRKNALAGEGLMFYKYEPNEKESEAAYIGLSLWHPDLLNDARGDFLQMRHSELLRILYNRAVDPRDENSPDNASSGGVTVLFDAEVIKIDCDVCSVTLRSGETHSGDAIIGADGESGMVRQYLIEEQSEDEPVDTVDVPTGVAVYSAVIPKAVAMEDEDLAKFYEYPQSHMVTVFMGHNRGAKVSLAGKEQDLWLVVYTPDSSQDGIWTEDAERDIKEIVGPCNPLLYKLAAQAGPSVCLQMKDHYDMDSWVSKSGKVVVVGEGAHPFPPTSTHTCSVAIEDGAFIGKIFSHTRNPNRISEFLYAFEEHRKQRCSYIIQSEKNNVKFISIPDGEKQETRDTSMRANHAAGLDAMDAPEADMQSIMDDIRMVYVVIRPWSSNLTVPRFDYDPADDADEWWVSWGRFRESHLNEDN